MTVERQRTARRAEALVASYLRTRGYTIVGQNIRIGRLELDLVATRGALLVICEVRSRSTGRFGSPIDTLTPAKIGRIRRAAATFLRDLRPRPREIRLDAASVTFRSEAPPQIDYYRSAL